MQKNSSLSLKGLHVSFKGQLAMHHSGWFRKSHCMWHLQHTESLYDPIVLWLIHGPTECPSADWKKMIQAIEDLYVHLFARSKNYAYNSITGKKHQQVSPTWINFACKYDLHWFTWESNLLSLILCKRLERSYSSYL